MLRQVVAAFHHITELEAHGINRNDVQRLSDAGYCTVESVRVCVVSETAAATRVVCLYMGLLSLLSGGQVLRSSRRL